MIDLPSGLHRYTGDSTRIKFRIVFSHPTLMTEQEAHNGVANKHQIKKRANVNKEHTSHSDVNVKHQASYLIAKQQNTGEWCAEEIGPASRGSDSPGFIDLLSSEREAETGDKNNLAKTLKKEGFVLKVVSVPSESRSKCHFCRQKLSSGATSDEFNHKSGIPLFDLGKQKNERAITDRPTNKLETLGSQRRGRTNANDFRNILRQSVLSNEFWNLVFERRRASRWKDTLDMTSAIIDNHHWAIMDVRRLCLDHGAEKYINQTSLIKACDTISLLMRNHYHPLREPCQCSRIKLARTDKTFDDFCAVPLICALCLTNNGSASDNNENRNNLDRSQDTIEIPINEHLRSRCRCCTASIGSEPKVRHCRCGELRGGYKRCLRIMNRLSHGSEQTISDSPTNDPMSFLSGLDEQKSANIEKKALQSKIVNLLDSNQENSPSDCKSRGDPYLLLGELDLTQEVGEHCNPDDETDFLIEVSKALENSRPEISSETLKSNDVELGQGNLVHHANRMLKSLVSNDDLLSDHSTAITCHCDDAHGETLVIIMEKYNFVSPKVTEFNLIVTSRPESKEDNFRKDNTNLIRAKDERDNKEEQCTTDKPDKLISETLLTQLDEQSMQQQQETLIVRDQDLSSSSTEKPIGTTKSGSLVGEALTLTDSIGANSNKTSRIDQDYGLNEPHNTENYNYRPDGDQTSNSMATINDPNSDTIVKQGFELPLNVQKLDTFRDNHNNHVVHRDVQQEHSIVLAVITIDLFKETINVKPDLNKLILLDMSHLSARSGKAFATTTNNHPTNGMNLPNALELIRFDQVFYHVEILEDDTEFEASEKDLNYLLGKFGLQQQIHKSQLKTSDLFERSSKHYYNNFVLNPTGTTKKDVLLKIQFDIHYACGFPSDSKDIYIKYKIYSIKNEIWHIERQLEVSMKRDRDEILRDVAEDRPPKAFTHLRLVGDSHKDKTKLEHMTHFGRQVWTPYDSSVNDNDFVTGKIANVASDKWHILGGSCHEINRVPVMESCDRDSDRDNDDDDYQLLLEGSTITSRPDSCGRFNFCCVEQLLLELSRKTTKLDTNDQRDFSTRMKQDDAIIPAKETKSQEKIPAKIDEQKSFKPIDENQMQTQEDIVGSPTMDCMTSEPSSVDIEHPSPTAKHLIGDNRSTNIETNHEGDRSFQSCKIGTDQTRSGDLEICTNCKSSDCPCDKTGTSRSSKGCSLDDTDLRGRLHNAHSDVCQILFVFEVYSRDFYSDKLRGWSSMNVPISLNRNNMGSDYHLSTFNSHDKATCQAHGRVKCNNHRVLPVMTPALCTTVDRLRYYLIGEIPRKTPRITSFVKSDCRYMTQTQHCGNLVVGLEVLRQNMD